MTDLSSLKEQACFFMRVHSFLCNIVTFGTAKEQCQKSGNSLLGMTSHPPSFFSLFIQKL